MPAVQRQGDKNNKGEPITQGDSSVKVNGKPIAPTNAPVAGKGSPRTKNTQSSVKVNGKPVVMTNDRDTNGATRMGGSSNVKIGR